jgi:hypothetical protein
MPYKFGSKASGDVIMLQAHGDALLRLLGREPEIRKPSKDREQWEGGSSPSHRKS